MANSKTTTGAGSDDELSGALPIPPLQNAKSSSAPLGRPAPSPAAMELSGAGQSGSLIGDMMQLEQLVKRISQRLPALINVATPFIQQMRDLGAAAMADQTTGGMGATNPEAAAPPPGAGGMPMGPGGPGAGGGMPGGMPIPPVPMVGM